MAKKVESPAEKIPAETQKTQILKTGSDPKNKIVDLQFDGTEYTIIKGLFVVETTTDELEAEKLFDFHIFNSHV